VYLRMVTSSVKGTLREYASSGHGHRRIESRLLRVDGDAVRQLQEASRDSRFGSGSWPISATAGG